MRHSCTNSSPAGQEPNSYLHHHLTHILKEDAIAKGGQGRSILMTLSAPSQREVASSKHSHSLLTLQVQLCCQAEALNFSCWKTQLHWGLLTAGRSKGVGLSSSEEAEEDHSNIWNKRKGLAVKQPSRKGEKHWPQANAVVITELI